MNYEASITKGRYGFKARTIIPLEFDRRHLHIDTHKTSRGGLATTAQVVQYDERHDGCFSFVLFQDFSTRMATSNARCTEKNITAVHMAALEDADAIAAEAKAFYGPGSKWATLKAEAKVRDEEAARITPEEADDLMANPNYVGHPCHY